MKSPKLKQSCDVWNLSLGRPDSRIQSGSQIFYTLQTSILGVFPQIVDMLLWQRNCNVKANSKVCGAANVSAPAKNKAVSYSVMDHLFLGFFID